MSKPLLSHRDVDIYQRDAQLFREGQWLNDTCINFCFRCLEDNSSAVKLVDPAVVSFLRLQVEEEDEYEGLAKGLQLDHVEWLYCPINDNADFGSSSTHWSALLLHVATGRSLYLDSHSQYNLPSAQSLLPKLAHLLKRHDLPVLHQVHCPQQDNGYDCGVFVVIFASFILDYITTNELSKDAIAWASNLSAYLHGKFVADLPSRTRKHYRARIDELKR